MKEQQLPVGISPEQYQTLLDKFGKKRLRTVEIPPDEDGDGAFEGLAVVPDRTVYGQFERLIDKDPDRARKLLIQNCLYPEMARQEVLDDLGLFLSVSSTIIELLPLRKGNSRKI